MDLHELFHQSSKLERKAMPLIDFLEQWADDPNLHLNTAGRILRAIGEPTVEETSKSTRRGRMFSNRTISTYRTFSDLIGVEETVQKIVQFFKVASQGAEQKNQILYLFGPVGSGKSKIVETIKRLVEDVPVWVLGIKRDDKIELSPVLENPLGLFDQRKHGLILESKYRVPVNRLEAPMSRWAHGMLEEEKGNYNRFVAVEVWPTMADRCCIARIEPGDNRIVDVGTLIGRSGTGSGNYDYSGGLNCTTQGVLEFVEMFKASPKLLYALLGVTQDKKYSGQGAVGELPYQGIIIAHSNEQEWLAFKKNEANLALCDRICEIEVPYGLSIADEAAIYRQYLDRTGLQNKPCVRGSLEVAARFAVSTRVVKPQRELRIHMYDGRLPNNCPDDDKKKTTDELRAEAKWREGMTGVSRRYLLKLLPIIADSDPKETALDPVSVLEELKKSVVRDNLPEFEGRSPSMILEQDVEPFCKSVVSQILDKAFFGDYTLYLNRHFEEYATYLDSWAEQQEYKNPETGSMMSLAELDRRLADKEKEIPIGGRKDFRTNLATAILKIKSRPENQEGPLWNKLSETVREKLEPGFAPTKKEVIEVIQFRDRTVAKELKEHDEFLQRLYALNVTKRQARRLIKWHLAQG